MQDSDPLADRVHQAIGEALAAGEIDCAPGGGLVTGWVLVGQYADGVGDGGWFVRSPDGQVITTSAGLLDLAREVVKAELRAEVVGED
jgi:hypothetical protein